MGDLTRQKASAVVAHFRFPDTGVIVDVGAGDGTLLASILQAFPHLRGVLFDLPHVIQEAEAILDAAGSQSGARSREATSSSQYRVAGIFTCSPRCCTTGTMSVRWTSSSSADRR